MRVHRETKDTSPKIRGRGRRLLNYIAGRRNEQIADFAAALRGRRIRTMREFAEATIRIPDGPYEGRRYRCDRQPFAGLLFDQIDSDRFDWINCTGPTQSGKSLAAWIIPALYHLFEVGERVIVGLPDMRMAQDKWQDILPVIEASDFADQLPTRGEGSKGGNVKGAVRFENGHVLRFMTGGGQDKGRAGYTARVLVISETDQFDVMARTSAETTKLRQLFGRTRAYTKETGYPARIYSECTVSLEHAFTWQQYKAGTASRIMLACPHCAEYVALERNDLQGWREAATELEARANACFVCSACGKAWTEEERKAGNQGGRLIHRGQTIDSEGQVSGDPPATRILGFRWSAVNNNFTSAAGIGADEWRAERETDNLAADRELCQQVWAVPPKPLSEEVAPLQPAAVQERVAKNLPRGQLPDDTQWITVGVDIGKYLLHYTVMAWRECRRGHILDYGRVEVPTDDFAEEHAIRIALHQLRTLLFQGWPGPGGHIHRPDQMWIDSGWQKEPVYAICREAESFNPQRRPLVRPTLGRSIVHGKRSYSAPRRTGASTRFIGENYHGAWFQAERMLVVEIDVDRWKTWIHRRLVEHAEDEGAVTLFAALRNEHTAFAHHLTAEAEVQEYRPGVGYVTRWHRKRKANHWFDSTVLACVAGHFVGFRLTEQPARPAAKRLRVSTALQPLHERPY